MPRHLAFRHRVSSVRMLGWRVLLRLGYAVFAVCPRHWRFACALKLSRITGRLLRWISYYPPQHTLCLDGYRESALAFIFDKLTLRGVEFDPALSFVGDEPVWSGGAIIISGHFHLNFLYLRLAHDSGKRVSLLMKSPPVVPRVAGTRAPLGIIRPDKMSLVRIRRRVAAGEIVGALVDTPEAREGRPSITTPHGTVFISDEIMRLAERAGLPILFGTTRVAESGQIIMKLIRPTSTRADDMLEEFCQFLRSEIAQVAY